MGKTLETLDFFVPTEFTQKQEASLEEAQSHCVETQRIIGQLAMVLRTELELPAPDQQ